MPPAVTAAYEAPRAWWLWDSPYLKASVTVGLFCDKAVPALALLLVGLSATARWCDPPAGWSPLEYSEDLMPSLVGLEC